MGRESMLFGIGRRSGSVRAGMSAAGIGWIEVAPLRLRIAGVSVGGVGIGQGKIVDCGGDLGVITCSERGHVTLYMYSDILSNNKNGGENLRKQLTIRIPKTLHAELLEEAKEEGVSLNQLCLFKLARPANWYRHRVPEIKEGKK